ncbi:MAG: indolepyruvate oxidoreductase subunit beta [Desulfurococcaceae archaeon]|jgi:indolepyruvate ferredoxin oxidoreductase beta subunit|nr:indolepyruvate oxidoreductase subunit beta [Desulfurococcaceae archaeon]
MASSESFNILIAGVGGQGVLTLSRIIGEASLASGLNVLVAETHGLSQRGGAVVVHVRIGDVDSPLVPLGEADLMIGLELLEVIRNIGYMRRGGFIVADRLIIPPSILDVKTPSLDNVIEALRGLDVRLTVIPASEVAEKLGDVRVANVYLLGQAISITKLGSIIGFDGVVKVLRGLPNPELNLKAFKLGYMGGGFEC